MIDVDLAGRPPLFRDAARVVVADRVGGHVQHRRDGVRDGRAHRGAGQPHPGALAQLADLETRIASLAILESSPVLVWVEDLPDQPAHIDQFLLDLAGR